MIVGIDYDSYKAVLCGLPFPIPALSDQPTVETIVFRPASRSGDDAAIAALKTVNEQLRQSDLVKAADVLWLERGFGNSRRADFILGAFFGAVLSTLVEYCTEASVNPLDIQEWKREISAACGVTTKAGGRGNGQLKKELAHQYVRQVALRCRHNIDGFGPDALDAYAIAYTGRLLNQRALERGAA